MQHKSCCNNGGNYQQSFQYPVQFIPNTLLVQIPQIDIIRNKLSEDNRKIITQPPIDTQQIRTGNAQNPKYGRRYYLLCFFR